MIYADYAYYSDKYGGDSIPESDFSTLALRSSEYINATTFGRLENGVPEEFADNVSRCCCEIAENIHRVGSMRTSGNGAVTSEKIGGYSVNYQSTAEQISAFSSLDGLFSDIIRRYLSRTGLIYRGVYD